MPVGTIILTGVNSNLNLAHVRNTLKDFPSHHTVLTVWNDGPDNPNTAMLRETITTFPNTKYSIRTLELASLDSVHSFTSTIAGIVTSGRLPTISTIVRNTFTWSITNGLQFTGNGYELSFDKPDSLDNVVEMLV